MDPAAVVLGPVRGFVGSTVRRMLTGHPDGHADIELAGPRDPGLFGPGSVTWRVHADRSMLVGGLRALFLQVMHPLAMAGVAQHSAFRTDPLGRLLRTSRFVGATTYGSTAEAERAIGTVRRIHERVRGVAPDGRPYSATDPALLAWVHNVEVESFLLAYRRYGGGLTDAEADQYVREMTALGGRLGATELPDTVADLRAWIDRHPDLAMTADARRAVRFLLLPPLPAPVLPAYGVIAAAAADLLPVRRRLALGLVPVPLADPLLVRPATAALLSILGWALGAHPSEEIAA